MRYISVFSGIEAASVAWSPLGWEAVAFSELGPFPSAVLAHRFPDVPNLGDITLVDWREYAGKVDLVVGGSPCQSFSIAGDRTGLNGASGLMWEYVRAVREIRPRWIVWENVPGALSSTHGEDFGCLLRSLDELGYGLAWRVLDAQFFGVAQRRRRVFLVGCLGDPGRAAEILFERESLCWDSTSGREKRKELASSSERGIGGHSGYGNCLTPWDYQNKRVFSPDGAFPTIYAGEKSGANQQAVYYNTLVFDSTNITSPQNGSNPQWNDPAHTMNTLKPPTVICVAGDNAKDAIDRNMCGTLKVGGSAPLIAHSDDDGCDTSKYIVRRLTPVECERLQGFPDGWTDVEYKGKKAPDGNRYKALGNSMAVPVMRWIGERIDALRK